MTTAADKSRSSQVFPYRALLVALAVYASGCAPIPRPDVLVTADQVRAGAAAQQAKRLAPGAFAHAEKLRHEADAAFAAKDLAGAQILGERALAAYAHANVLARVAEAESQAQKAKQSLSAAKEQLAALDADQKRVEAEAEALELQVKVVRDAQPIVPSGPADPDREKARLAAARTLALQARLLCSAARLLLAKGSDVPSSSKEASANTAQPPANSSSGPAPADALASATAELDKLDAALSARAPAPIDAATRARAGCLAALTKIRRTATLLSRAPGAGDALLAELSRASWSPSRDDRGVFVTLRGIFSGDALTPSGESRVADLGRVAAAHPDFPVAVVLHHDTEPTPAQKATSIARAEALVRTLKRARVTHVEAVQAGAVAPVVDPNGSDRARNVRVEIVFIMPESF